MIPRYWLFSIGILMLVMGVLDFERNVLPRYQSGKLDMDKIYRVWFSLMSGTVLITAAFVLWRVKWGS